MVAGNANESFGVEQTDGSALPADCGHEHCRVQTAFPWGNEMVDTDRIHPVGSVDKERNRCPVGWPVKHHRGVTVGAPLPDETTRIKKHDNLTADASGTGHRFRGMWHRC